MKLGIFGNNPGRVKDAVAMFGEKRYSDQGSQLLQGNSILMDIKNTYAHGVHALRDACITENNSTHPQYTCPDGSKLYRPLTFKETIMARLTEFNTLKNPDESDRSLDERVKLMLRWNDSCTGIAYKAGTTKFRIIPVCEQLILIDKEFNSYSLAVPYASLTIGVDLDSKNGIYNSRMTKQQIEEHEGWRAALEDDVALLRNYRDDIFTAIQQRNSNNQMPEKAMSFFVRQNTNTDELRALFVGDLEYGSIALGDDGLGDLASFVRVAPSRKISP